LPVHVIDGKDEPVTLSFGIADADGYFAHRAAKEPRPFRRNMACDIFAAAPGGSVHGGSSSPG